MLRKRKQKKCGKRRRRRRRNKAGWTPGRKKLVEGNKAMREAIEDGSRTESFTGGRETEKNQSKTERSEEVGEEDGQRSGWTMGSVAELRPACCCCGLERNRPRRAFQRHPPKAGDRTEPHRDYRRGTAPAGDAGEAEEAEATRGS